MPRRLVICCDGTWDKLSHKDRSEFAPSNVARVAAAIAPHGNGMEQATFYHSGIGTGNTMDRWLGGSIGFGISDAIKDCYQFLVHNFMEGDEVFFFGFSRGAYTVRSLAGFIRKCGLLHKHSSYRIDDGYDIYRLRNEKEGADSKAARWFREQYSWHPVPIKFIGVWDTVGALGLPSNGFRFIFGGKYLFHDVELSSSVAHGYQAVAIDEKRRAFRATLWTQTERAIEKGQRLEQKWFPGAHSDIGGGSVPAGLSNEALRWMRSKAQMTGLAFNEWAPAGNALDTLHESWRFPYTIVPKFWRPIGTLPRGNESMSEAALKRFREVQAYNPPNLVRYLEQMDEAV